MIPVGCVSRLCIKFDKIPERNIEGGQDRESQVQWFGAMVTWPCCFRLYCGSSHHGVEEEASHLMATKGQESQEGAGIQ